MTARRVSCSGAIHLTGPNVDVVSASVRRRRQPTTASHRGGDAHCTRRRDTRTSSAVGGLRVASAQRATRHVSSAATAPTTAPSTRAMPRSESTAEPSGVVGDASHSSTLLAMPRHRSITPTRDTSHAPSGNIAVHDAVAVQVRRRAASTATATSAAIESARGRRTARRRATRAAQRRPWHDRLSLCAAPRQQRGAERRRRTVVVKHRVERAAAVEARHDGKRTERDADERAHLRAARERRPGAKVRPTLACGASWCILSASSQNARNVGDGAVSLSSINDARNCTRAATSAAAKTQNTPNAADLFDGNLLTPIQTAARNAVRRAAADADRTGRRRQ